MAYAVRCTPCSTCRSVRCTLNTHIYAICDSICCVSASLFFNTQMQFAFAWRWMIIIIIANLTSSASDVWFRFVVQFASLTISLSFFGWDKIKLTSNKNDSHANRFNADFGFIICSHVRRFADAIYSWIIYNRFFFFFCFCFQVILSRINDRRL